MKRRHYKALDAFRGVAALMVALYHFGGNDLTKSNAWVQHAWLFVDFFFVLSGFVLAHTYFFDGSMNFARFIRARLARLYPLMLYTLLVMLVFEGLKFLAVRAGILSFESSPFSKNDPQGFILNLLMLTSFGLDEHTWNVPAWSIAAEFWVNVVVAILFLWSGARRSFVLISLTLVVGAALALSTLTTSLDVTWDFGGVRCLYGFVLGMTAYAAHRRWPNVPQVDLVQGMALILGVVTILFFDRFWFVAPPIVFTLVVWAFSDERGVLARLLCRQPFAFLARISYSVYLNHLIVVIVVSKMMTVLFPSAGPGLSLMAIGLYLGIVVGYSTLTFRYIEEPARRALSIAKPDHLSDIA